MTTSNHQQIRVLLAHYRDLNETDRQRIDQHLVTCTDCRAIRAAYEQQNLALRALPSRAPSSQLHRSLTAELARSQPVRPWYRRVPAELAFMGVAAVLLLAFLSLIRLQEPAPQTASFTATPAAVVVGVSGTAEPPTAPTRTPPAVVTVTTTLPVTATLPLSTSEIADTLPWMTYAIDQAGSTTLLSARADGAQSGRPQVFTPALAAARVSPDGLWTAVGRAGVELVPNNGEAAIPLVTSDALPGEVVALAWAPDSSALAMTVRGADGTYQVETVRLQAGLPRASFGFERGYPHLLGWDAAGQQVVVLLSADEHTDASGQIQVLTPGQAPVVQPYSYAAAPGWRLRQVTLGPRGRWVYYLADQPNGGSILVRQSLRDGSQTVALSATLPIDSYVLADDENHVVYTLTTPAGSPAARSNVRLLTFSDGKPVLVTDLPGSPASLLSWSPTITSPLASWIMLSQPSATGAGQRLVLLRPSDGISLPVTIDGLVDAAASDLRLAGWAMPAAPVDADIDAADFDQTARAVGQALARQQWPDVMRWLTGGTFTHCAYKGACTGATSTADALMMLAAEFRDAEIRVETNRQVVEPPGFTAPGEAALLVHRTPAAADADSSHVYLQRSEDGRWQLSGILTGVPFYDAPSLAEVRAAPTAFSGLEVVLEGEYFVSTLPPDLPIEAPHLGQWVLRDASGTSLWVRNATPDVAQGIEEGSTVQVLGVLKVEQGWPFLEVSLVRPLLAGGS